MRSKIAEVTLVANVEQERRGSQIAARCVAQKRSHRRVRSMTCDQDLVVSSYRRARRPLATVPATVSRRPWGGRAQRRQW